MLIVLECTFSAELQPSTCGTGTTNQHRATENISNSLEICFFSFQKDAERDLEKLASYWQQVHYSLFGRQTLLSIFDMIL